MRVHPFACLLMIFVSIAVLAQNHPVPFVNQPLYPDAHPPDGVAFTLTVLGSGFVPGSVVYWNGSARTTTFLSGSKLQAAITVADDAAPGTAVVTVVSPAPGGGTSNFVYFQVQKSAPTVNFTSRNFAIPAVLTSSHLLAADFNHDGKVDLAIFALDNSKRPSLQVFPGNGDGTFQNPVITTPISNPNLAVAMGDFNGDGELDILTMGDQNGAALLGHGDGTFTQGPMFYTAADPAVGLATGDFNGDGKLDYVATWELGPGDHAYVSLGNGDATFTDHAGIAIVGAIGSAAVGDFTGDGNLDAALAVTLSAKHGAVEVARGMGDGALDQSLFKYRATAPNYSTLAGDLNHDGVLDLVTGAVNAFLGQGGAKFQRSAAVDIKAKFGAEVEFAEFNNDDNPDVALLYLTPTGFRIGVLLGNGDGTFQGLRAREIGSFARATSLGVADFNGDGRLDIVTCTQDASDGPAQFLVLLQKP
jgi:hypothetical protein